MKILAIEKEIEDADGSNTESTLKAEALHDITSILTIRCEKSILTNTIVLC